VGVSARIDLVDTIIAGSLSLIPRCANIQGYVISYVICYEGVHPPRGNALRPTEGRKRRKGLAKGEYPTGVIRLPDAKSGNLGRVIKRENEAVLSAPAECPRRVEKRLGTGYQASDFDHNRVSIRNRLSDNSSGQGGV
jgi:hypothetical protein